MTYYFDWEHFKSRMCPCYLYIIRVTFCQPSSPRCYS